VVRLGQNFLADANLLEAIVRDAELEPDDVVLEVGGGEGSLTERLAPLAAHVHVIEIDERLRPALEAIAAEHPEVQVAWGDAMRVDLGALDPPPTKVVSNLPYSIATPLLLRTIDELPGVLSWTVLVQREIADRLRAAPGGRAYGSPSVLVQLACGVELRRAVDRAVFRPRPRVDSALLRLTRHGSPAGPSLVALVRGAFSHRRKTLAGSLELAGGPSRDVVRPCLRRIGLPEDVRAEALAGAGEAEPVPVPRAHPRGRQARDPLPVLPPDACRSDRGQRVRRRRGGVPGRRGAEPGRHGARRPSRARLATPAVEGGDREAHPGCGRPGRGERRRGGDPSACGRRCGRHG
jgi:16S rRNA (adenine1518-N6/adenine1519-N6)-dimethyltransferase